MKFYASTPWMTAALAAALLAATATAADPKDKDAAAKEAPAKVDQDVEAWIKVLTDKITDRHDSIRESARHALTALGKPALPALQKLADGADGAAAEAAKHVIAHIEGGHDGRHGYGGFGAHYGPYGHHGRHGFGGGIGSPHWGGPGSFGPPHHPGASEVGEPLHHPGAGVPGFGFGPPPGFGFGPRGGGAGAIIERATKDSNLTEAQIGQVKEILKAQGEKAHEAFQKMHEDLLKSLKGVLNEEQLKKLESNLPKPPTPGDLPGLSDKPAPPKK